MIRRFPVLNHLSLFRR